MEQPTPVNAPSTSSPGLSFATREALLWRHVYQCFSGPGFVSQKEGMQQGVLQSVRALFGSLGDTLAVLFKRPGEQPSSSCSPLGASRSWANRLVIWSLVLSFHP